VGLKLETLFLFFYFFWVGGDLHVFDGWHNGLGFLIIYLFIYFGGGKGGRKRDIFQLLFVVFLKYK